MSAQTPGQVEFVRADIHDDLLGAILKNADEDLNGFDGTREQEAEHYVRWLESERERLVALADAAQEQLAPTQTLAQTPGQAATSPSDDDWLAIGAYAAYRGLDDPAEAFTAWRTMPGRKREDWRRCANGVRLIVAAKQAEAVAAQEQPAPELAAPEVQFAPCPVEGHDGKHMQWRSGQWTCGHVLANSLILGGILPVPPERPAPALTALRSGILGLAADLDRSAAETRPSRKSEIEAETAIALRRLLETP